MNSELYFEGKKYISAKRASEITGYNSDYIGQLCRGFKIEARRVGRGWFMGEDSVLEHKKNASEKSRGIIYFPPTINHYLQPFSETFNQLQPSRDFSLSSILDEKLKKTLFYLALIPLLSLIFFFVSISHNKDFQSKVTILSGDFISFNQTLVLKTLPSATSQFALALQSVNGSSIFNSAGRFLDHLALNTYHFISGLFNFETVNTFVLLDTKHIDAVNKNDSEYNHIGVVTSPSTGNAVEDERLKKKIKDSFSDETKVYPDNSGTSGVIKPVFKKSSDQDYLYVVVPVGD